MKVREYDTKHGTVKLECEDGIWYTPENDYLVQEVTDRATGDEVWWLFYVDENGDTTDMQIGSKKLSDMAFDIALYRFAGRA